VADYPFTTIQPVLGTVERPDGSQIVVLDVPGLLEGASEGVGMGHEFLAHFEHFERARMLVHLVSLEDVEQVANEFHVIVRELWKFDPRIARLPQIVVLSKTDLVDEATIERARAMVEEAAKASEDRHGEILAICPLSSATGQGLPAFLQQLFRASAQLDDADRSAPERAGDVVLDDYRVFRPRPNRRRWRIYREKGGFRITGDPTLRSLAERAEHDEEAAEALTDFLANSGALRALRMAGARSGQDVTVAGVPLTVAWDD
jgi:GTP-binding protein